MEDQISKLSLRPFHLSDIDDFMVWASDDLVTRFCSWDAYTSKEGGLAHLRDRTLPHPWHKTICLSDRPIGSICLTQGSGEALCRGEIGYALAFKYWGQGLATHAVNMVLSSVFKDKPELERIEALVDADNVGSQRVLEKVGFKKEGLLRKYLIHRGKTVDVFMYSFLSTDLIK
ncbi:hypothetical protein AMTRI_Chr02g216950 [Amborella trichopoda]|uniref:uncharacterized protein LOC105420043 n=1 Tax=Amborella trichopoda TaxID=13333 RepID=UPI0005D3C17C|nr:uncharacterized protein LOC105420043 [Amborella trichopoda]|eukprot:XP_011620463.1 uncharacterized protein LOC105420043 [Amborella trichopoda]